MSELRRCFANAVKYNGAHLTSDTTGSSQRVYEAALMMQEKLEGLLSGFTLSLCERIERMKISNAENATRMAESRAKAEKEEAEARKFEQKVCKLFYSQWTCRNYCVVESGLLQVSHSFFSLLFIVLPVLSALCCVAVHTPLSTLPYVTSRCWRS